MGASPPIIDPAILNAQRQASAELLSKTAPPGGLPAQPVVPPPGVEVGSPDLAAAEGADVAGMYGDVTGAPGGDGMELKDGLDLAQVGAGGVGGVLEALGMGSDGESAYNLPGAGGADSVGLAGVGAPFSTGKMKAPDRQSLALALLR